MIAEDILVFLFLILHLPQGISSTAPRYFPDLQDRDQGKFCEEEMRDCGETSWISKNMVCMWGRDGRNSVITGTLFRRRQDRGVRGGEGPLGFMSTGLGSMPNRLNRKQVAKLSKSAKVLLEMTLY
jgi:hypothetical protein